MTSLLPFRFMPYKGNVLLTNFVGDYHIVNWDDFSKLLEGKLTPDMEVFQSLQGMSIISSGDSEADAEILSTRLRTKKAFLEDFTSLHMVVTTLRCNQQCRYCHATAKKEESSKSYDMDFETARKTAKMIMCSPSPVIKVEFQGGDSSLNMPIVREIVAQVEALNKEANKDVEFVICTNLLKVSSDELDYLRQHNFFVSVSLDGPQDIHDTNRVDCSGAGTYTRVIRGIQLAREYVGFNRVSALMTATRTSLGRFPEIVDEYLKQGFRGIVFRSLNPYGRCIENWEDLSYPIEDFIESFKEGLIHIIELNKRGIFFVEGYSKLLLSRMLMPFSTGYVDLQSPAGAGISGAIYDYKGKVYACDEGRMLAEMGDERLCLGHVDDRYEEVFAGERLRSITRETILETTPRCSDCAYAMWCGADPARHYATQHDLMGHKAKSDFCKKHRAIFEFLIELLESEDTQVRDILFSWIGGKIREV